MSELLLNIRSLSYIDAAEIGQVELLTLPNQMPCLYLREKSILRFFKTIPVVGAPLVESSSTIKDGTRIFTVTLSALTASPVRISSEHPMILMETVDGSLYMMGTHFGPWVAANYSEKFPDRPTDRSEFKINLQWQTDVGIMRVKQA